MKATYIVLLIIISCLLISCRKDVNNPTNQTPVVSQVDVFDYAADEAQFLIDDTEGDEDAENGYIQDGATPMKITAIYCYDSIALTDPLTGKAMKGAKRAKLSNSSNNGTPLIIAGYGFKDVSDTSRVECIIAKTKDTLSKNCYIKSWSDTKIEVSVPRLDVSKYPSDAYISLKLKVFRSNDKLNKKEVSRVKSRASISKAVSIDSTIQPTYTIPDSIYALSDRYGFLLSKRVSYLAGNNTSLANKSPYLPNACYFVPIEYNGSTGTPPKYPTPCYNRATVFEEAYRTVVVGGTNYINIKWGTIICNKNTYAQGYNHKVILKQTSLYNWRDANDRPQRQFLIWDAQRQDTVSYLYHYNIPTARFVFTENSTRVRSGYTQETIYYYLQE